MGGLTRQPGERGDDDFGLGDVVAAESWRPSRGEASGTDGASRCRVDQTTPQGSGHGSGHLGGGQGALPCHPGLAGLVEEVRTVRSRRDGRLEPTEGGREEERNGPEDLG